MRCRRPARNAPPWRSRNAAAVNETQARIARVWADVLGLDDVGINDPFMELGGDSLLAFRVMIRIATSSAWSCP